MLTEKFQPFLDALDQIERDLKTKLGIGIEEEEQKQEEEQEQEEDRSKRPKTLKEKK